MKFKDMMVNGGRVSAEWQEQAWTLCAMARDPGRLTAELHRTGPREGRDAMPDDDAPEHWLVQEIASRMLQKARKAGVVAYVGKPRRWWFL